MARVTLHRVPREHVYRIWPLLYSGVTECLAGTNRSHHEVLSDLISEEGEELFVIMIDAKQFVGFVTLRIFDFGYEVWGTVGILYVESQAQREIDKAEAHMGSIPPRILEDGMVLLEEHLAARGCTHMNYVTSRKGFQRFGPRLGFRSRLIEWVKEV